jgi:hypothetical protein
MLCCNGYIRAELVPRVESATLLPLINKREKHGSIVYSDHVDIYPYRRGDHSHLRDQNDDHTKLDEVIPVTLLLFFSCDSKSLGDLMEFASLFLKKKTISCPLKI